MRRTMFLPIVIVLGAVALFAVLLMTGPISGSSDVTRIARQAPLPQPSFKDCSCEACQAWPRQKSASWPCAMPSTIPLCNGSLIEAEPLKIGIDKDRDHLNVPLGEDLGLGNCDMPMLQRQETRPEAPGTPYYDGTGRDGAATLYDITRKQTRLAAYKLGLRGPACTATRDSILGH